MTFPTPLAVDPLEHVLPHDLIPLGPVAITNQMLMALVAAVLMLLIFPRPFRRPYADLQGWSLIHYGLLRTQ